MMNEDKVPDLVEAVENLEQWHFANSYRSPKTELYWAQKVHFLSVLVLLKAQDAANGKEAKPDES